MLNNYADLHLHTIFSDGFSTPEVVIKNAYKRRFRAIAITDHETIDGVERSIKEAAQYDIEVVPGLELSASIENGEIHILGYFVDHRDADFQKTLNELKEKREVRLRKIVKNLSAQNVSIDFDQLLEFAGPGTLGRLHLAHFMRKIDVVSTVYEAFDKYIGSDKPAYVKNDALAPKDAIELILSVGGVPVLAHPQKAEGFDELLGHLISLGLKGLEVYHSKFNKRDSQYLLEMTNKYNLLVTGGSDCHGKGKLVSLMGKVKLPYEYVTKLKNYAGIECPA